MIYFCYCTHLSSVLLDVSLLLYFSETHRRSSMSFLRTTHLQIAYKLLSSLFFGLHINCKTHHFLLFLYYLALLVSYSTIHSFGFILFLCKSSLCFSAFDVLFSLLYLLLVILLTGELFPVTPVAGSYDPIKLKRVS